MTDALAFDFDVPPADLARIGPTGAPINGLTHESRASSRTGADCADERRSENLTRMRALWRDSWTLNELASLMNLPLASICSLKSSLESELTWVDYQVQRHGPSRRATRRSRWRIRNS